MVTPYATKHKLDHQRISSIIHQSNMISCTCFIKFMH